MNKIKYLAILAVAVMFISVISVMSITIGGKMHPPDGQTHQISQTITPPIIDSIVNVPGTWPTGSLVGYMWVTGNPTSTQVAEVYALLDWLENPANPYVDPLSYKAADWTGFYLYIAIKALPGYTIEASNEVLIDWDQDGTVDFSDHNGNSQSPGQGGFLMTQFAYDNVNKLGTEWAIPYMDEFNGVCQSPFDIYIHCDVSGGGYNAETATFPDRPPGPKYSTTFCPWDLISPEEPPEPGCWGLRTIGFWKHQFNTALGIKKGHQHVPTNDLYAYVEEISDNSQIPELQNMDSDLLEALLLLELRGKHPMYDKAVQQLLAVWLNYVSGNTHADLDGDGVFETSLLQVIQSTEAALLDGDPTNDEFYKDLCDAVNNS